MSRLTKSLPRNQKDRFSCPGVNTYFTAAVLFGSIGARRVFGSNAQYTTLLTAFPLGFAVPFVLYYLQKLVPRNHWFRSVHPVMLLAGGIHWSPVRSNIKHSIILLNFPAILQPCYGNSVALEEELMLTSLVQYCLHVACRPTRLV